ncbi:hypothetical protein GOARA_048_00540 [Gordonia araii NBRC 100433]|uniref:Immunity protein Imm33 domain-containing protein n=1 Tax=Gordonia araii NBRC 100433 TaxID=1073574 RepID=G7H1X7_9ACTN|nr:DUF2185 domain-containing protein [Gordonia araii]NNG97185.1 DUF2185 domain-containing protein [Gordonia araii NBRC 100433]GAB09852.1 hypothetical protein GOARA_048_00540 [Gordonia araii NBRC 100433]
MPPTEFIPNAGTCLATTNVLSRRGQVRWMVREKSRDPADSGWRIMSDVDTQEYLDSGECWHVVDYNAVCAIEPALIDMWRLPVGSDLQLVRDQAATRIVETATGRQVIPVPSAAPTHHVPGGNGSDQPKPRDRMERENGVVDATFSSLSTTAGWDLALVTITFTDEPQPAYSCLLYATGDEEADLDAWFASHTLPKLPFVAESRLPSTLVELVAEHRLSMPDAKGALWSSMQFALERDGSFYFYNCRYR